MTGFQLQHDGSAYLSTKKAIEEAEDRGDVRGMDRMQQLIAEYFERTGRPELAGEVRALKLVEKG